MGLNIIITMKKVDVTIIVMLPIAKVSCMLFKGWRNTLGIVGALGLITFLVSVSVG